MLGPLEGWDCPKPFINDDYIDTKHFFECWNKSKITGEVDIKAKECAVMKLYSDIRSNVKRTLHQKIIGKIKRGE